MRYTKEFSVDDFQFWSGAKDTVEDVRKADKMAELETVIETAFEDRKEPPTATEINDFVWFERDFIYEQLGLDKNGNLPDEDEEENEDEYEDEEDAE